MYSPPTWLTPSRRIARPRSSTSWLFFTVTEERAVTGSLPKSAPSTCDEQAVTKERKANEAKRIRCASEVQGARHAKGSKRSTFRRRGHSGWITGSSAGARSLHEDVKVGDAPLIRADGRKGGREGE